MERNVSRRSVLGVGVAATAAAATVGPGAAVAALADPNDPRSSTESVGSLRRVEVLSAPTIGEEVRFYAAASMTPNGSAIGTTLKFGGPRGAAPVNPVGGTFNYASVSVDVPVGSRLTNIEYVIEGSPQAGRLALIRWTPDSVAGQVYLFDQTIPAAVNGTTFYAQALSEVVDGLHTYEAFYADNGTALTNSWCNGIRVRYLPPGNALVPITPVRVYDSRLNMAPDANGPLSSGANRTVSVANTRDVTTGVATGTAVSANATAIAYTLTVADTTAQGFLAVNPGGNTVVSASSINWKAASQEIANTGVVKLGPNRTITAVAGGGGTTNFIIDIVGYYL